MPELKSDDGRYLLAIQGDGNAVVYDRGRPVWDRWSYEAAHGPSPSHPPSVPPVGQHPDPPPSVVGVSSIRVTSEIDGDLLNSGYSYWSQAWVSGDTASVFVGHADGRTRFFHVNLTHGQVTRLGPLLPYLGTGEGWSWDAHGRIYLIEGHRSPRLRRVNPFDLTDDAVVLDISESHPGHVLWQSHSSDSGQTHSATVQRVVQDGAYPNVGTVVIQDGWREFFAARGTLDESALVGDRWLVIKETPAGHRGEDNRVIDLTTRETPRLIKDAERALGHSDCGDTYMVGEADKPDPGMCGWWDLTQPLTVERFKPLFSTTNMGYVSVRAGRILHSGATYLSLIDRQTGAATPLVAHGGSSDDEGRVKANLSPCGRVATYMAQGTAYLLVLP